MVLKIGTAILQKLFLKEDYVLFSLAAPALKVLRCKHSRDVDPTKNTATLSPTDNKKLVTRTVDSSHRRFWRRDKNTEQKLSLYGRYHCR